MTEESFYIKDGDFWQSMEITRGPWSPDHQHAGPPSALLSRALEEITGEGYRLVRISIDIPRPVPIARLKVATELIRPGRTVRHADAQLRDEDGTLLMQAKGLALRVNTVDLPEVRLPEARPLPSADESEDIVFPFFSSDIGYHTAMHLRLADGDFGKGPCAMWMRMRYPLVAGEIPTPLQRVMIAADSGNGVSSVLDTRKYGFVNPDLTVYLDRYPAGEWVCLDASTTPRADGIGLAVSVLRDQDGIIGRGLQSLVISKRKS